MSGQIKSNRTVRKKAFLIKYKTRGAEALNPENENEVIGYNNIKSGFMVRYAKSLEIMEDVACDMYDVYLQYKIVGELPIPFSKAPKLLEACKSMLPYLDHGNYPENKTQHKIAIKAIQAIKEAESK